MKLDWYDRGIVSFVMESGLSPAQSGDNGKPVAFGIDARRILHRFSAVVDLSERVEYEGPDQALLRRAARYRASRGLTPTR